MFHLANISLKLDAKFAEFLNILRVQINQLTRSKHKVSVFVLLFSSLEPGT